MCMYERMTLSVFLSTVTAWCACRFRLGFAFASRTTTDLLSIITWHHSQDKFSAVKGLSLPEAVHPTFMLNYVFSTQPARWRQEERPVILHRWGGLGCHRYPIGFSGSWQRPPALTHAVPATACAGISACALIGHLSQCPGNCNPSHLKSRAGPPMHT